MELLLGPAGVQHRRVVGGDVDLAGLAAAYVRPVDAPRWVSVNMVSTLDGAATGADGVTGSINSPSDKLVFDLLRALSDIVVIGAGTARAEGYGPLTLDPEYAALRTELGLAPMLPLALVTRTGQVPERLRHAAMGAVLVITSAACPALAQLRADLGHDQVIVAGDTDVDLGSALTSLVGRGFHRIHSEGGPRLLGDLLHAGLVDELCLTLSPLLVAGPHRRIVEAAGVRVSLLPHVLLHADGDLIGRWLVRR
jgi:riboflavin biosynthesis pyrimidine reductase